MARWQNDLMLDEAFAWLRERATRVNVCSALPAAYACAINTSGVMLAQSSEYTSTNFTLGDGDVSGRKVHVDCCTGVTVSGTGTANHIVLTGSSGSTVLYATICTTQALTSGNTVNVPAWDAEILDADTP